MADYDVYRPILTQVVDFTSVSAAITNAISPNTQVVRLAGTAALHFRVYDAAASPTCTSSDPLLPFYVAELFAVTPGQKVSFIKAQGGGITSADGRVTVTEMA